MGATTVDRAAVGDPAKRLSWLMTAVNWSESASSYQFGETALSTTLV